MQSKPRKNLRYAYVIDACCFLLMFTNMGFVTTTFNVFQPYINALPTMGDTLGSWVSATRMFASFVATFFSAAWYKRLNCRLGAALSCGFTALGLAINAVSTSFPGFCLGAISTGIAYGIGTSVAITLLIGRWFDENRATAIGIASMGSGFTAVTMPIITTHLIETVSLSAAFAFEAAIAAAVGIIVFALVRNYPPGHPGLLGTASAQTLEAPKQAQNAVSEDEPRAGAASSAVPRTSVASAVGADGRPAKNPLGIGTEKLPRRPYSFMLLSILLVSAAMIGTNNYLSALLQTSGFTTFFAAGMITLSGAIMLFSKFLIGRVFDLTGPITASLLFYGSATLGIVLLCLSPLLISSVATAGVVFYYLGMPVGSIGMSIYAIEFSNLSERAQTVRNFQLAYTGGSFLTNLFPGALYDLCGTYVVTYALYALFFIVAGAIVVTVLRRWRETAESAQSA